jgi:ABC-2 type transport system permease protein
VPARELLTFAMLRGERPASVLPAVGLLLAFAAVVAALAARLFRWDDV